MTSVRIDVVDFRDVVAASRADRLRSRMVIFQVLVAVRLVATARPMPDAVGTVSDSGFGRRILRCLLPPVVMATF